MIINVYGTNGCVSCKRLHEIVKEICLKENIEAEINYVNDLNLIISKGIMQMPALEVDGSIKSVGRIPKIQELINMLKQV